MGFGEPPPIEEIATAVRDRAWLDIRALDRGQLQRVCPLNITVWPDRDEVLFRQDYRLNGEDGRLELTIDAEDIMWARPTILDKDDVIPPILPDPEEELSTDRIAAEIIATVCFAEQISEERLKGANDAYYRKLCIRLMWELTTVRQDLIPQHFGYQSGGMTPTALHYTATDKAAEKRVRELWDLMQLRVGHTIRPVRRNDPRSRQRHLL